MNARLPPDPDVLFDLDGTLVDSVPDIADAVNAVLAADGLAPLDVDGVRARVGDGARVLVRRAFEARDRATPDDALARFLENYGPRCTTHTRPYPGIPELLDRLRAAGRRLAVVTNKPTSLAEIVVRDLLPHGAFEAVVGPELVSRRKPAPEHVTETLARLALDSARTVLVGDGTTDVASGRDAGVATVAVGWGYRPLTDLLEEQPTATAETVAALGDILLPV